MFVRLLVAGPICTWPAAAFAAEVVRLATLNARSLGSAGGTTPDALEESAEVGAPQEGKQASPVALDPGRRQATIEHAIKQIAARL